MHARMQVAAGSPQNQNRVHQNCSPDISYMNILQPSAFFRFLSPSRPMLASFLLRGREFAADVAKSTKLDPLYLPDLLMRLLTLLSPDSRMFLPSLPPSIPLKCNPLPSKCLDYSIECSLETHSFPPRPAPSPPSSHAPSLHSPSPPPASSLARSLARSPPPSFPQLPPAPSPRSLARSLARSESL